MPHPRVPYADGSFEDPLVRSVTFEKLCTKASSIKHISRKCPRRKFASMIETCSQTLCKGRGAKGERERDRKLARCAISIL